MNQPHSTSPDLQGVLIDNNLQSAALQAWAKAHFSAGPANAGKEAWANFLHHFRASKALDNEGLPVLVYRGEHGESSDPIQTRRGSITFCQAPGVAAYYARDPNDAEDRNKPRNPRILAAYVRIENPVMVEPEDPFLDFEVLEKAIGFEAAKAAFLKHANAVYETNHWQDELRGEFDSIAEVPDERLKELFGMAFRFFDDHDIVRQCSANGYDGVIHCGFGGDDDAPEYKVFSESQIISPKDGCPITRIDQLVILDLATANQIHNRKHVLVAPQPQGYEVG